MTLALITTCLLTIGLLFTTPVAPKEEPWPTSKSGVTSAVSISTTPFAYPTDDLPAPTTSPAGDERWLTATAAPLTPAEPPLPLTPQELVDSIFGWPGRQLVQCESGWNQWAVGPYGERGLLQIHGIHARPGGIVEQLGYTFDDMFQIEPNLRVAVEIRRQQGLRAWTCWRG